MAEGRVLFVEGPVVMVAFAMAISVLVTVTVCWERVESEEEVVVVDTVEESEFVVSASVRIPVGRVERVLAVNVESVEVVVAAVVKPAPFPTTVAKSNDATDVELAPCEVSEDTTAAALFTPPNLCR
jgi:hypothetical protein